MARIRERRRALSTGRAVGVRATQTACYVAVRLRPPPSLDHFPAARAWLALFDAGRRDAGAMAREACLSVGRFYAFQGKYDHAVKRDLRALGLEHMWALAKIKSGRPPRR